MESLICVETIEFGDDNGDGTCTFKCELKKGHRGRHLEKGDMGYEVFSMPYTLRWSGSQRELDEAFKRSE